jgi:hypothetical protein
MVIPIGSVQNLSHYAIEGVAETKGWLHFTCSVKVVDEDSTTEDDEDTNVLFSTRLINEVYPDLDKKGAFTMDIGQSFRFPSSTIDALRKAAIFAPKDDTGRGLVTLSFMTKGIMIYAESAKGQCKEPIKVSHQFTGEYRVYPENLLRILNLTLDCTINDKMMLMKGDNWKYAITLKGKD